MALGKESPGITRKRKESPLSGEQINEVGEKPLDSNNTTLTTHVEQRSKSRKTARVPSGKFKGVVPQQNGNWGAQIYANHQRIWLGTFKTEQDAAMAYDSAAIKLRSGDSHRNFPWTHDSIEEPRFQSTYSTRAVLNMIKEGTYQSKFNEFLRTRSERPEAQVNVNSWFNENGGVLCRQLFQKELTPSDVGKLNRLVIPKKYAIKYFPNIRKSAGENRAGGGEVNDMQLVFYDKLMRSWKFRYCYWSSSQSFVFTKGWSRFVKEKALKAGDVIAFYLYDCREPSMEPRTLCVIDVCRNEANGKYTEGVEQNIFAANGEIQFELGEDVASDDNENPAHDVVSGQLEAAVETKGFKLFGVEIN